MGAYFYLIKLNPKQTHRKTKEPQILTKAKQPKVKAIHDLTVIFSVNKSIFKIPFKDFKFIETLSSMFYN